MTLSLALAAAALLTGQLPAGHPPLGTDTPAASSSSKGGLPAGHPSLDAPPTGSDPSTGALPEGHPATTGKAPPTAEELLKQLDGMEGLRERQKTFEIASSLGKLYSNNGRPADAISYYVQAEEKAKPARELYLAQRKKLGSTPVPSAEEAHCGFTVSTSVEQMVTVVQERAGKGDGVGAAACARAALEPVLEVQEMHAGALFLTGKGDEALKVYQSVLDVAPKHADALFGRSALLYELHGEDTQALQQAHEGFEAFATAHPQASRAALAQRLATSTTEALKAGGMKKWLASRAEDRRIRAAKLDLKAPPPPPMDQGPVASAGPMSGGTGGPMTGGGSDSAPTISQETMQAMQNVEHTPELEAQLNQTLDQGEDLLAHGHYDEALKAYRQVMPLRPDGRVKAGLAWTLVGLGKPTAERVWGVAVSSDPAAVDKLGETLKAKGDTRGAKALWTKLAASAPDYAASASLQAKLEP